jgi:hypothetical protein
MIKFVIQALRQLKRGEPDKALTAIGRTAKLRKSDSNRRALKHARDEAELGDPAKAQIHLESVLLDLKK